MVITIAEVDVLTREEDLGDGSPCSREKGRDVSSWVITGEKFVECFGVSKEVELAMKNAELSPKIPASIMNKHEPVKKTGNLRMNPPSRVYPNMD
ncbi:MAG: hypothetical protein ACFFCQ_02580 [Promethearchaeota archaeon]